ncbi:CbiX/SirB N-terminal domain-containing protein, partial [Streptomyces sp. NPDC007070]|uniref:CbiX/SirB N-terminal domain-containing protein n=1 Tax=Streptomyces sp. NPDC007070 TaxID=3154312 RepID=UPI0033C526BF
PDSAAGTRRTARLLAERIGVPVVPAYASAAAPTVEAAVRALAERGRHRVAVASCFTAPGRFATECARAAPWIAAAPLGDHPALARLVLHRYDQALGHDEALGHDQLLDHHQAPGQDDALLPGHPLTVRPPRTLTPAA